MASLSEAVVGRVTRSRAAALHMMSAASQDSDAAKLDKKNQNVADPKGPQRKRKAVLQDTTNIRCESYYKDCFNPTKLLVSYL